MVSTALSDESVILIRCNDSVIAALITEDEAEATAACNLMAKIDYDHSGKRTSTGKNQSYREYRQFMYWRIERVQVYGLRPISTGVRGSGKTSYDMLAAPRGATYVWCTQYLHYPRELAIHLGREDLNIVGPDTPKEYGRHGVIVFDHAHRP